MDIINASTHTFEWKADEIAQGPVLLNFLHG